MEIERQLSEAPDVCVIVKGNPVTMETWVERFEDERGQIIAERGQEEYRKLRLQYRAEIAAIREDLFEEMKGQITSR